MTPSLLTFTPSLTLALLSLGIITQALAQNVSESSSSLQLSFARADYYMLDKPSVLSMECVTNYNDVTFWREVNGTTEKIEQVNGSVKIRRFVITPDREGEYYCSANGQNSEPPIEVLAYPIPNATIQAIKTHTAPLGADVTIPCVYTPGALAHRYSIQWFKGLTELHTNTPRFQIRSDFSLVISDVNALDSSVYYCVVDVTNKFSSYHRTGPSVQLVVRGTLTIPHPPEDVVISLSDQPSSSAVFTCTAFGLPPPSIVWLHQGRNVMETTSDSQIYSPPSEVTTDTSGTTITSQLHLTHLKDTLTGYVQCLVTQDTDTEGERNVLSRQSHLTVLPDSLKPTLLPTSTGVELSLSLPTLIPTTFTLVIYYYNQHSHVMGKVEIMDMSFFNTDHVEYLIMGDKLPPDLSFSVKVSVKVGDVEGGLSQPSNDITLSNPIQTTSTRNSFCNCPTDTSTTEDDSSKETVFVVIIVLLIVLLTVAVGVAIWSVAMVVRRGRMKHAGSEGSIRDDGSYSGKSYSRSRSRSSSLSRSSRSRSRSRSRSCSYTHSPSFSDSDEHTYRSGSKSRSCSPFKSRSGTRQDPEGSLADNEYVPIQGAPPISGGQTESTTSGRSNSVTSRPLPSTPFEEHHKKAPPDPPEENAYDILTFDKIKPKRGASGGGRGRRKAKEGTDAAEQGTETEAPQHTSTSLTQEPNKETTSTV